MKPKEKGYVLSVDPASNKCGVALWKDGRFVNSACLSSRSSRDPFSIRMQTILDGLDTFLQKCEEQQQESIIIGTIVTEGVRSRLVSTCIGSLMVHPAMQADLSPKTSFVEPSTWKKWAKDRGATGPSAEIKGINSLEEIILAGAFQFSEGIVDGDDAADAVMIYQAWRDRA